MKFRLLIAVIPALFLAACNDGDGVPAVEDAHNIVVGGQKIAQTDFLKKYCRGKTNETNNETCMRVLQAAQIDSTRGKMPKW